VARFAVILPAAGESRRFRDPHYKKPFAPLENRAVWLHTAERFINRPDVAQMLLVVSEQDQQEVREKFGANLMVLGIQLVLGGATRCQSVARALEHLQPQIEYVAIHDAVRPCLAAEWIDQVFAAAMKTGAAILAIPVTATLKQVRADQQIERTVSREHLWEAQTPQVFRRDLIMQAYQKRRDDLATDDAQLVELLGHPVTVVRGSPLNVKITTKEDLKLAALALKALPQPKLSGPLHPFDEQWR
jgi:2-C-methyl-D-erythritol 4-phosphate cytidylyltransferase